MAEKKESWKPTCKRFVAFLDIMGFKDMVFRNNHADILNSLKSFQPAIKTIEKVAKTQLYAIRSRVPDELNKKSVVRPVLFSDSIIIVSSDDSFYTAIDFLDTVAWVFYQAISKGIPLKGAIAYGVQTSDFKNSLHFGRPLIDAFELQNELLLYGVVFHHTLEKYFLDNDMKELLEEFNPVQLFVPMKTGKITHFLVDWTVWAKEEENVLESITNMFCNVSGSPRLYIDNTLEFVRWLIEEKAKQKNKA